MTIARYLPRFRKAYRQAELLAERERWTRSQIETFQLERINAVWEHAIAHVPYYVRLAKERTLPTRFSSIEQFRHEVPLLTKAQVRAHPQDFLSAQPRAGGWHRTGGSTGTPMGVYWEKGAHLEMQRAKYRHYAEWGIDIFDRTTYIWGHSASFAPAWKGRIARLRIPLEDRLRRRMRLSAYHLGHEDLCRYLDRIKAFRPLSMYGYSRAMYLLALEAETKGFDCDSLKLFTLTGEPAFPFIVEKIESVFGVPATIEYGSIECGSIASEGPDRTLRLRDDMILGETLARDDGRYELALSVLNNRSFPLLRYLIGDVTDAPLDRPDQGFTILKNVAGRNNDFIVARSGRFLHSARFDAFFKYESKGIRRFRVRQWADGSLCVALETDGQQKLDTDAIQQGLCELVEGYPVHVEVVDTIPQTVAGKHRLVMSQLAAAVVENGSSVSTGEAAPASSRTDDGANEPGRRPDVVRDETPKPGASRGRPPLDAVSAANDGDTSALRPRNKAAQFRMLIERPGLDFIMEAHNGLSARIVEETGFEAIWASGLSISASLGVRDSNEASWTQVLDVLEFMSDATRIPILVDGDTGYGNFNNLRRLVRKLEQRNIGGVCIEDKVFPKTNSFINGSSQSLADVDEFCGRIKAGKDAQWSDDFVVIARVEAFIAGLGLEEAMKRATAYHEAGADAILIHSARRTADEVLAFKEAWGNRSPVVIVPTKYFSTPTEVFRHYGFSAAIWANHLMRCCITAMQRTATEIYESQSLLEVEHRIVSLKEVFRIQGADELAEAEERYLPKGAEATRAIILAAARGEDMGEMTELQPKCMVRISGKPILAHIADAYRSAGVKDLHAVRGYMKEAVTLERMTYHENPEAVCTREAYSLYCARSALEGNCIVSFGDVLFRKYVVEELVETDADFAVVVDADWRDSRSGRKRADYVHCSEGNARASFCTPVYLLDVSDDLPPGDIHGEWMGFLKVSAEGARFLQDLLVRLACDEGRLRQMRMADVLQELLMAGKKIQVLYTAGHWFDVDGVEDLVAGSSLA